MQKSNSKEVITTKSSPDTNNKEPQQHDSITSVNRPMVKDHTLVNQSYTLEIDGERDSVGFKCNVKLWKEFVKYSIREYGSVCHILEPIMFAILHSQVVLSNTIREKPSPIVIENLHIERTVQRVRRYSREYVDDSDMHYCALHSVCVDLSHVCDSSCPNKKCLDFMNHSKRDSI